MSNFAEFIEEYSRATFCMASLVQGCGRHHD